MCKCCGINNIWAARLTDYIETRMQEASCGEALYGFWHVGATICSQLFESLLFYRSEQKSMQWYSKLIKRGHHSTWMCICEVKMRILGLYRETPSVLDLCYSEKFCRNTYFYYMPVFNASWNYFKRDLEKRPEANSFQIRFHFSQHLQFPCWPSSCQKNTHLPRQQCEAP